jgi:hypothetical protein
MDPLVDSIQEKLKQHYTFVDLPEIDFATLDSTSTGTYCARRKLSDLRLYLRKPTF